MHIGSSAARFAAAASIFWLVTANGSAQPSMHPQVQPASSLVKVSACSPQRHGDQGGRYFGYTPGTAGPGNLYWGDAYGYSYYQPPASPSNPHLNIAYMNVSHKKMTAVEFGLLANEILVGEVRDTGTFSPGAEIKHKLGLNLKLFPIPAGPERCVPLRITFADGTKWRSPHLPPKGHALYYNPTPRATP